LGPEHSALTRLVPDLIEPTPLRPDAGERMAYQGSEPMSRLFAEMLGMLERMTSEAPVVLAIEDVHWADRSTQEVLALLVRATAGLPLLVVFTCRTDELPPADPVLSWLADLGRARPMVGRRVGILPAGR
jgi:predicted ATPase